MSNSSEIKFRGKQADGKNGMQATFDLETGDGYFKQDVSKFLEQAKRDREKQEYYGIKKNGYRKLATIPDVIALKIALTATSVFPNPTSPQTNLSIGLSLSISIFTSLTAVS